MSPQDAMVAAMKGKDVGIAGEGAIINWDLSSMMDQVQKASDCAKTKRTYKCGTSLITPAIQTIASCFDGRALLGMVVCLSQAPQNGSESWFSCTMGEKLASLKSRVVPKKPGKIEKVIKEKQDKIKKCEKSLKDKPTHKFAPQWKAQITGLTLELQYLDELKVYDASKDQTSVFLRKKLGLFAETEGAAEDEQIAVVRKAFEQADSNGDKELSLGEFRAIFAALSGGSLLPEHVDGLFEQIDTDNDKSVSFDEFFTYMFPKP